MIKSVSLLAATTMAAISATHVMADDLRDRQTAACSGDAMRLCSDAIPDEGKVASCMMAKKSELNSGCRAFFVDVSTSGTTPKTKASHQPASFK